MQPYRAWSLMVIVVLNSLNSVVSFCVNLSELDHVLVEDCSRCPSHYSVAEFPGICACFSGKNVGCVCLGEDRCVDAILPEKDRKGVLDNPCPATYNASYCQKPYYDGVKGKCFFFCEDSVPGDPNTPADEPTPWRDDMYLLCTENQTNMTGYAVGHIQSMEQYDGLAEFLTKELNISGDIFMSSRFSVRYHTEDHNSYTGMNISWLDWETTLNDSLFEAFFPPVEDLTSFDGLPFIFLALTNPNDGYDKWKMKQVGVDDAISWLLCENNSTYCWDEESAMGAMEGEMVESFCTGDSEYGTAKWICTEGGFQLIKDCQEIR